MAIPLLAILAAAGGFGRGLAKRREQEERLADIKETRAMQKDLLKMKLAEQENTHNIIASILGGMPGETEVPSGQVLPAQARPAVTPQQYEQINGMPAPAGNAPPAVAATSAPIRPRLVDMLVQDPRLIMALESMGVKGVGEAARLHAQQQEARTIDAGDRYLKIDRQGNVIGEIPKSEEWVSGERQLPDGRVEKFLRPRYGPQDVGTVPLGTAPPPIEDREFEGPEGAKYRQPFNKVTNQPVGPPVKVEAEKPPTGEATAGRLVLGTQAVNQFKELQGMLFDENGKLRRELVIKANAPFGGIGEGRKVWALFKDAMDARIRASSGAAISKEDLQTYKDTYLPSPLDNDATAADKLERAIAFAEDYAATLDPTGKYRKRMPAGKSTAPGTKRPAGIAPKSNDPLGWRK